MTVLSGTTALNCTCTFMGVVYDLCKRWRASRTRRLQMMALVVAMAGMILPAISVHVPTMGE